MNMKTEEIIVLIFFIIMIIQIIYLYKIQKQNETFNSYKTDNLHTCEKCARDFQCMQNNHTNKATCVRKI